MCSTISNVSTIRGEDTRLSAISAQLSSSKSPPQAKLPVHQTGSSSEGDAFRRPGEVLHIKPDKFGSTQSSREADKEQCLITNTGHVIAALASDPDVLAVSGRTLIGAELARQYGITDRDGRQPPSVRELMSVAPALYHGRIRR